MHIHQICFECVSKLLHNLAILFDSNHHIDNIAINFSYAKDGILYLKPTLTSDTFGEAFLSSEELDIWGGQPGDR